MKTSKNYNQTYLQTSKQSAVTAKHKRNFPQPARTIIQERRKKFARETIDFLIFVWLTVIMVNCFVPSLGQLIIFASISHSWVPGTIGPSTWCLGTTWYHTILLLYPVMGTINNWHGNYR